MSWVDLALIAAGAFFCGCVAGYLHTMPGMLNRRTHMLEFRVRTQAREIDRLRRKLDA